MMDQISKYFNAEKHESVLFVIIGCIAIVLACYFFMKVKLPFYTGMAYPFMLIGIVQITVGSTVYVRSPKDILRVNQIAQTHKQKIQTEEIPRMNLVMKNFTIYKWIEVAFIVVGVILFIFFQPTTFWKGVGLGMMVQGLFMLVLDFFAESRGNTYLEFLQTLN